ncbi:LysR family transcriptional regulator [Chelativorans sp. YIM 93263]|uniref:LysR family transcriptional regulator n=1 Tax=Chelativorans sp. YIM 93263 TaxID=2906648 RepID=UPI002378E6FD|nr:LysR family transcriptional regulator [Chelativorans sp. YIM 93263]
MANDHPFRLKLNHFRLIAAIAEHGQISPAAASLSMTQPAASRTLTQVEGIVGAPLFERHARGMRPTEVGQVLSRHADALLTEMRETMREVEEFKRGVGGRVRVGAVTGAAVGYVMPAIHRLKEASPNSDVHIEVAPSDTLIRDLASGHLDFALARVPPPFDPRDFVIGRGRGEIVDLLVRKGHPLADVTTTSIVDLGHFQWIMQAVGAPLRVAVENAFIIAGAQPPRNTINTTSLLAMIALLLTSNAIAPLSREVTEMLDATGSEARLQVLPIHQSITISPYHLLQPRGRPLSPLATRLKELISEELAREN